MTAFLSFILLASAPDQIERKELFKAEIGAQTASTIDVREIEFKPSQKTGRHRHPCPCIGYIAEGSIRFQIQGQEMQTIDAAQICYEPANTVIDHNDNASDKSRRSLLFIIC